MTPYLICIKNDRNRENNNQVFFVSENLTIVFPFSHHVGLVRDTFDNDSRKQEALP